MSKIDKINLQKNILEFHASINDRIQQVCEPLFQHTGLSFFLYRKIYEDGNVLYILNDLKFAKIRFEHHCDATPYYKDEITKTPLHKSTLFIMSDRPDPKDKRFCALYDYGVWNIAQIYKRQEKHIEVFGFGAPRDHTSINNLYLNHSNILEHFAHYFTEQCHDLLNPKKESKYLVKLPEIIPNYKAGSEYSDNLYSRANDLSSQTKLKRYYIDKDKYFTRREVDCLNQIIQGKTMKESARSLGVSSRTVESYIKNMKFKFGCNKKSQLIDLFQKKF